MKLNQTIEAMCKTIGDIMKENEALSQRIKRLEEGGDEAICALEYASRVRIWTEAKEVTR
jgi:cell division protein FtsB